MTIVGEPNQKMKSARIQWIDFVKGVTILLVIIGHTTKNEILLFFIYSFHMPLFFALSVMTSRFSENTQQWLTNAKRSYYHLIIPAFVLWLIHDLLYLAAYFEKIENIKKWIAARVLSFLFSSGQPIQLGSLTVPSVGILWFLVALYVGRTIFDWVCCCCKCTSKKVAICLGLGILGIAVGQRITLPLSMDHALTVQPFFMAGLLLKKWRNDEASYQKFTVGILGWAVTAILIFSVCPGQKLEISQRLFPFFPLCFAMACFAVLALCELSKFLVPIGKANANPAVSFITAIGRNSIWLFGVHHMDGIWKKVYTFSENNIFQIITRLTCDIVVMFVVLWSWHFLKERRKTL